MKTLIFFLTLVGVSLNALAEVHFLVSPSRSDGAAYLREKMITYYSSLIRRDYFEASKLVYGYPLKKQSKNLYFINGFDYSRDLEKVTIVDMIAFKSRNEKASGFLTVVRFDYSSAKEDMFERYQTDAWFVSSKTWKISPNTLMLFDRSFDPIPASDASSLFLSPKEFDERIQKKIDRQTRSLSVDEEELLIKESEKNVRNTKSID